MRNLHVAFASASFIHGAVEWQCCILNITDAPFALRLCTQRRVRTYLTRLYNGAWFYTTIVWTYCHSVDNNREWLGFWR